MKKEFLTGLTAMVLAIGFMIVGCDNGSTDDGPSGPTAAELAAALAATLNALADDTVAVATGANVALTGEVELADEYTLSVPGGVTLTVDTDGALTLATGATVSITGTGAIALGEADGSLITVGTGQTLNVTGTTLRGKAENTAPLVTVTGASALLNLNAGAKVTGNSRTVSVTTETSGSGVLVVAGGTLHMASGSEVSGNTLVAGVDVTYLYGAGIGVQDSTATIDRGAVVKNNSITAADTYKNPHGYGAGIYAGDDDSDSSTGKVTTLIMNGELSGNSIEFAATAQGDRKAFGAGLALYDEDSTANNVFTIGGKVIGNTIHSLGLTTGYYLVKGIHIMTLNVVVTLTADAVIGADQEIFLQAYTNQSVLKVPHGWTNGGADYAVKLVARNGSDNGGGNLASMLNKVLVTHADSGGDLDATDLAKFQYWAYSWGQGGGFTANTDRGVVRDEQYVTSGGYTYSLAITSGNLTVTRTSN